MQVIPPLFYHMKGGSFGPLEFPRLCSIMNDATRELEAANRFIFILIHPHSDAVRGEVSSYGISQRRLQLQ